MPLFVLLAYNALLEMSLQINDQID
jgi:hypothetical protein